MNSKKHKTLSTQIFISKTVFTNKACLNMTITSITIYWWIVLKIITNNKYCLYYINKFKIDLNL